MSDPIADTAEYFVEKETAKQKPSLRIFPSLQQQQTPQDLLSPESPENRRLTHLQHQTLSDFDPKLQWQKVLKRLPSRRHSRRDSQEGINDSDSETHDEYELNTAGQYIPPKPEDDVLPSTDDIQSVENPEQDNYFTNPFHDILGPSTTIEPPVASGSGVTMGTNDTEEGNTATVTSDDRAKKHWGKTLDKVRLIANLHALPQHQHRPSDASTIDLAATPLAPYYPPLFDPVFIALSKDQHGHGWAPVLLPFLKVRSFLFVYHIDTHDGNRLQLQIQNCQHKVSTNGYFVLNYNMVILNG